MLMLHDILLGFTGFLFVLSGFLLGLLFFLLAVYLPQRKRNEALEQEILDKFGRRAKVSKEPTMLMRRVETNVAKIHKKPPKDGRLFQYQKTGASW